MQNQSTMFVQKNTVTISPDRTNNKEFNHKVTIDLVCGSNNSGEETKKTVRWNSSRKILHIELPDKDDYIKEATLTLIDRTTFTKQLKDRIIRQEINISASSTTRIAVEKNEQNEWILNQKDARPAIIDRVEFPHLYVDIQGKHIYCDDHLNLEPQEDPINNSAAADTQNTSWVSYWLGFGFLNNKK